MKKGRKITGGRYKENRKKRSYEISGQRRIVKLGENKRKTTRIKGGNMKTILLGVKEVNVRKGGKAEKAEVRNVAETPSNRFLARQNIITKGTIVETSLGKVKITNRPSQEGNLNGVLVGN